MKAGSMLKIRAIGRVCGWLALALVLLTLLTGYGIAEFRIVTPLTFNLLNKAAAQRLHAYTELPMLLLLSAHIVIAAGARGFGRGLWKRGDESVIDGWLVNGSANAVGWFAGAVRHIQTGYLYHYAFAMIIGLSMLLAWLLLKS